MVTAHSRDSDPLVGTTIAEKYRVVSLIARGGMGRVYRGLQLALEREVALKVLDLHRLVESGSTEAVIDDFRRRFVLEAASAAKLTHPNTIVIHDYGVERDGLLYMVMEMIEGQTLAERIEQDGPLRPETVVRIMAQVCGSLAEAHGRGMVHRDLKPSNIMLTQRGSEREFVKVLDFGLVKSFVDGQELEGRAITQQGMLMGSPPYMAPEQGDKNRADPRSDIYSLGCILFEALTGKPPYGGSAPLEIILKHVNEPIPPVKTPSKFETIPEGMAAVVTKCLQKSPMDRFQSMDEVLQAMSELMSPVATPAFETPLPPTPIPAPGPARNNTPLLIAGFVVALLVGIGGTAIVLRKPGRANEAKVLFHIETEPPGAQVVIAKVIKGVTPLDIELVAVDGRAMAEVSLQKDGYLPMTVTAAGSGPRLEMIQKLQPVEAEKTPVVPPKPVVDKAALEKAAAEKAALEKAAAEKAALEKKPKVDPIDKAFNDTTPVKPKDPPVAPKKEPVPPKVEALPVVTPVKVPKATPQPKKPPPPKPASRLGDDEDPLAPHTPPPANDLKRPQK